MDPVRTRQPMDEIEAQLSAVQLRALTEDCMLLGIDRSEWRSVSTLRIKYESVAAAACALRLMRVEGRAWTDALLCACVSLGLRYEAVRKRLGSWQQDPRRLPGAYWEDFSATPGGFEDRRE